ncbi:TPA: hypothetical protein N0F65_005947 [Lagenidium giganteum]|uniref:YqaJ viral recombinase domain-containing protein n=1 Tax=Lagenidium giganteum TaxID=4803 RepID=A0AAV2ZAK9_9STRA|nr:TPA: hypothetical protein N0F65_005947 [Lagenidium giganteum]
MATRSRQMMLFASEVPVISAMNPYRKIQDVFSGVWRRTNPKQVAALEEELQVKVETPEQKMEVVLETLGAAKAVRELVEEAATAITIQQVQETTTRIAKALPQDTPEHVKTEIQQFVKSEMHKGFGIKQEVAAIEHYEEKAQVAVKERNLVFSKRELVSLASHNVFVGGKIDGKAEGKVVEVKNRLKRFMTPLPTYDIAQLQTYLFVLNASEGELVEHLRGRKVQTKSTMVAWDPHMWENQISPCLVRFSNALEQFMENPDAQIQFMRSDEHGQKEIIRSHWMRDIRLRESTRQ